MCRQLKTILNTKSDAYQRIVYRAYWRELITLHLYVLNLTISCNVHQWPRTAVSTGIENKTILLQIRCNYLHYTTPKYAPE